MKTLIKNANVFNGTDNKLYENRNILIENKIISTISDDCIGISADNTIDVQGKTVIPGLIDAHIHIMLYEHTCN